MSDQGSPAPRRALPPVDDVDERDGLEADPTEPAPPRRRLWEPSSSAEEGTPSTPIPPPTPVLPAPEPGTPSAGRRFSADLPDEVETAQPRRSALTPLPASAASGRSPVATGRRSVPAAGVAGPHRRRGLLVGGVAMLAVAGVVTAILLNPPSPEIPAAEPSVQPAALVLTAEDAAALVASSSWTASPVSTAVEATTPQPSCLPLASELEPRPASSTVGVLESTQDTGALLHQMDAYASPEEAATVFSLRREQLAACEVTVALTGTAYQLSGLGDEAIAVDFVVQSETADHHHVVLSRVGSLINVVDTSRTGKAFGAEDVALALAGAEKRQCAAVAGACPSDEPTAKATAPLPTVPVGWLATNDLPRITPGQGSWRGTDMETVKLPSSICDAVNLDRVAQGSTVAQRTYLLADDPEATANFGVDQGLYTFKDAKEAAAFVTKVTRNIADCPDRMPTASVKKTGDVAAAGSKGTSFTVSQKTKADTTRYRVTIAAVDEHALYLFANPGDGFDFSDGEWAAVSRRAAERLAQLS